MTVAGKEIGKGMFEPGRRWSTHVKPIAGTESCEFSHFMYVSSGRMRVIMDDGNEVELRPGDVASIAVRASIRPESLLADEPHATLIYLASDEGRQEQAVQRRERGRPNCRTTVE